MRSPSNKPGLLTLTIKDKSALYLAYMPFVKNGGLFIPTNSNYRLGDEVFMLLNLMGEEEKLPVAAGDKVLVDDDLVLWLVKELDAQATK